MCTFAVLAIAGAGLNAAGQIMQGNQAAALAEAQAAAYEQQAEADKQASSFEAAREMRRFQAEQGASIARVGASGIGGLGGSPSEVLAANAAENQLDLEAIRYGSQLRQNNLRTQADITRMSGRQQRTAGYIGAASSFVSGISQLYDPNRATKIGMSPFAR